MEHRGCVEIAKIGRDLLHAFQGSLQAATKYVERLKMFPY
jgi:hypothetical protein